MQIDKFSPAAQKILLDTRSLAKKHHSYMVEPEHLALALINTDEVKNLLDKKNLGHKALEESLLQAIKKLPVSLSNNPSFSNRLIQALSASEAVCLRKGGKQIVVSDYLIGLLENKDRYGALGTLLEQYFLANEQDRSKDIDNFSSVLQAPLVFEHLEQLNIQAKNNLLPPVFARKNECDKLVQILSRKNCNNPLLIGEPGVGKSSIIYALTKRIVAQDVPSYLVTKEILGLDISNLLAGATLRGQFEEKLKKLLSQIAAKRGQYILFIRDLSLLMGAGGDGASDAANLLKPSLNKGEVQIIGLVSPEHYKKRIEKDLAFQRFFQPVWVLEPEAQECYEILCGLRPSYEKFHGVFISDEALKAAMDLGKKHYAGRVWPQVSLDVLDEACARHRVLMDKKPQKIRKLEDEIIILRQNEGANKQKIALLSERLVALNSQYQNEQSLIESLRALRSELLTAENQKLEDDKIAQLKIEEKVKQKELSSIKKTMRLIEPVVNRDDVAFVVSLETGIPAEKMAQSEREKLSQMEQNLAKQVIGQTEAVKAVSAAIKRARAGLKDVKKPIGSFLFLGPTGVGKTELARTLTSFLFDDERAMVRFDMSEFMERHSVSRIIGAPPGYQGSDDGGQLTELVRQKPFSVILFDEIEKAHADVLNVLLQLLDEGRLSDSKGNLVNFNNTIIIMTSNIGSKTLLKSADIGQEKTKNIVMDEVLQFLRPELVNRIDEIILFNALDKKAIASIAELSFKKLAQKVKEQSYDLVLNEEAKAFLIDEGYSPEYGARPLKRTIQRYLENPLAELLISKKMPEKTIFRVLLEVDKLNISHD